LAISSARISSTRKLLGAQPGFVRVATEGQHLVVDQAVGSEIEDLYLAPLN